MATFKGRNYDLSNISGTTLAKLGREALEENANIAQSRYTRIIPTIDYESLKWLDDRISEVCNKGRI